MPETFISYARSLVGRAIEFYSCFISYSTADQAFAEKLHADLQRKGIRCWFAPEDLRIGTEFRQEIEQAIKAYDKLLLVLSQHSIRSRWVGSEVEAAFDLEARKGKRVLFPMRLDDFVEESGVAWAAEIRRRVHMADFSDWTAPDAYANALERLVRDLKSTGR